MTEADPFSDMGKIMRTVSDALHFTRSLGHHIDHLGHIEENMDYVQALTL